MKKNTNADISLPFSFLPTAGTALAALLLPLLFAAALLTGSVPLSAGEVWGALTGDGAEMARFIVVESRLPAALTAVLAGAALSASGLVMQTLFLNPLADPSLLGVNSGASLGAALVILWSGGSWTLASMGTGGVMLTIIAAFIGALAVIALLLLLSHTLRSGLSLLVAGVMVSFLVSAVISLLSFYASADGVRNFVVWGMGCFDAVGPDRLLLFALFTVIPCLFLFLFRLPLNALLLGEDYASNLGVHVRRTRSLLLLLTGWLTAAVTAMCGPVSFIGLAVPHMARLLLRSADHRRLLPMTLLTGADIALLSLVLTHLPGDRGILPLAAITPLIGVPVVIGVLLRRR